MVDVKVLEAQQWVNATYGAVPGYNRCPETGRTGWSTMYSLTRALQHELGISPLSDNFGPTTLRRLEERGGGIPLTEQNQNIVKIIQCACFCKGYHPGDITGHFGLDTQFAVTAMMSNAGLGGALGGVVRPKVMKALLTMDAYVVVAGGTDAIRSIQQWLNGRYTSRRDFFVIPCDGHFSRDVQKATMMAIQFELGMTDDQATGVFGPGTQAGLRSHPVGTGSSGVWVQLFSAAMVFNRHGSFTDSFGDGLATAVRAFQEFSYLPVTGRGDFATWAQLLVSTGDPTRPGTASDGITMITPAKAQALHAAGYRTIGRYLDERGGTLDKELKPGELQTIFANGLRMFPISQYYGGERDYFTYTQGFTDALGAHAKAVSHGFNAGTVIYFAVDYDATQEEIDSHIVPYFYGVVAGLASKGKRYVHGVYGSRNVCAEVTRQTYARWSFVSGMSTGFSGNMGFPLPENWAFNQIQTLFVGSGDGRIEIDKNIHRPGTDPAVSSVNDPSSPVDAFVAYVQRLYDLARGYGQGDPSRLVMEYLRHEDYVNFQWRQLIGDIDHGFVTHVKATGLQMIREYRDPFYGVDIKVSHFGASCNGHYVDPRPGGTGTNRGDVAGWGGDLMTFYGEWRRDSDSYASGYTYCQERLAKVDGDGTFKLRDLIEDADAYNIAVAVRAGTNIADAVRANLKGGGHLSRFRRYYDGRFGGSPGTAAAIAKDILLKSDDAIIVAGRLYLIQSTGGFYTAMPTVLPGDVLDAFCRGFGDTLQARVGQENARAAAWRADGGR